MDFQKYLKYKTKYLQKKNFLQKGGTIITLDGKDFDTLKYYSPIDDLSFLARENIDQLGFSKKYPDYYFDIRIYSIWDTHVQYQLKVDELKDIKKLPDHCEGKVGILSLSEVEKYLINDKEEVTAPKYKQYFEGYKIKTTLNILPDRERYFSFIINKT